MEHILAAVKARRRKHATLESGNQARHAGVLMTGRMQSERSTMSLLFYLTLFIVMCIFGWSVRGAGG
jgi:hypothetical protein